MEARLAQPGQRRPLLRIRRSPDILSAMASRHLFHLFLLGLHSLRPLPFVLICTLFAPVAEAVTLTLDTMETNDVVVRFERPLEDGAKELLRFYPAVKGDIERALNLPVRFRPTVILIRDGQTFREITENDMIVAFADPRQRLMVIDYSKMAVRPFTLQLTVKHELCHLLLHEHIREGLPRWLDEGVCQWVTGGLADIIKDGRWSFPYDTADLQGLLKLDDLNARFPDDRRSLILAYEESRMVIDYVADTYGPSKIPEILSSMAAGENPGPHPPEGARRESFPTRRKLARPRLRKRPSWLYFLAGNIYEVVLLLAALISIYAFLKIVVRRRRAKLKKAEEDDEEEWPA